MNKKEGEKRKVKSKFEIKKNKQTKLNPDIFSDAWRHYGEKIAIFGCEAKDRNPVTTNMYVFQVLPTVPVYALTCLAPFLTLTQLNTTDLT